MPQFAANLSMLYQEHAFLDRFGAAAGDGFRGVEYLFPYAFPAANIAEALATHGLQQVLFNAPPGDWERGERGIACLPGRDGEFQDGIGKALAYAQALRCPRVHVMAGIVPSGVTREAALATYATRLRWAAAEAGRRDVDILMEPINTRDMPGYLLNRQGDAHAIAADSGLPNLKVQMDLYHCQIVEGDLAMNLRHWVPGGRVGHVQIAGVPERHEPDVGEINYPYLFDVLDDCGYRGWVGCEYRPRRGAEPQGTTHGLGWMHAYRAVRTAR
ncbi:MAG: hydroxypyruvate isomerase family protein [Proteobacteria bacterium]|nr:hydroxypyruvate isomerase family protein [Pseudomonadota bacterium]